MHALADLVFERYLEALSTRGEVPSHELVISGWVSDCCGAPRTQNRRRVEVCSACRRPCGQKLFTAPRRPTHPQGSWRYMHIAETRSRRVHADRRSAAAADRWIVLEGLIEPRPRRITAGEWAFAVLAWALYLDPTVRGRYGVVERGERDHAHLGPWTDWRVRSTIEMAREHVTRRTLRLTKANRIRIGLEAAA